MGYAGRNVKIEYCGILAPLCDGEEAYVKVEGVRYKITHKTALRFKDYMNKEYAEAIEHFAYVVLVKKDIPNDGWFEK